MIMDTTVLLTSLHKYLITQIDRHSGSKVSAVTLLVYVSMCVCVCVKYLCVCVFASGCLCVDGLYVHVCVCSTRDKFSPESPEAQ